MLADLLRFLTSFPSSARRHVCPLHLLRERQDDPDADAEREHLKTSIRREQSLMELFDLMRVIAL